MAKREFFVAAHVLPRNDAIAARATTIANYLFLCRGVLSRAVAAGGKEKAGSPFAQVSGIGQISLKDNVQFQDGGTRGAGCDLRNSTIGKRVKIGVKCKLNNCVVMDDVVIGDGCVLQNTVVCWGAKVMEKCNLDNCIVAGGAEASAGTKLKNETIE
jgi:NDP-sugar pyrophosphorylase family protein